MQPGNGTRRAFQPALLVGGQRNHRTVRFFFDARGQNTDHALMPVALKQHQPSGQIVAGIKLLQIPQSFGLHALFNVAAVAVHLIQRVRQLLRARRIIGE